MLAAMKFPILSCAIVLTLAFGALNAVYADSAIWSTNPTNGDWNNPANWMPHTVPNGTSDVATFGTSTQTEISLSAPVTVAKITFNTNNSSYNITCPAGNALTFTGFGISKRSVLPQTFTLASAESVGGNSGALVFTGTSRASGATIINNGGAALGMAGGNTTFQDSSQAVGATLIANGGTNGGAGGVVQFLDHAIGATARAEIYGNGTLLIDPSSSSTSLNSIAGDGRIILNKTLTLRGTTDVTTFSGVISGSGGLIKKGAQASLTLAGTNSYSGRTQAQAGSLIVSNTTGSATGSGDVLIRSDLLGGDGIIAGNVTLANQSFQFHPLLSPGTTDIGTLTIGKKLILGSNSEYLCLVDGDAGESDLVVANAVSIDPTATLALSENGTAPVGMTFTIIESTGSIPIVGTFMNLPNGGTITVGSNTFHADYEGGDGNDLTLTAVP